MGFQETSSFAIRVENSHHAIFPAILQIEFCTIFHPQLHVVKAFLIKFIVLNIDFHYEKTFESLQSSDVKKGSE